MEEEIQIINENARKEKLKNYKIISLDPKIYYVESVPVYIEFYHLIGLNIIVLFLCIISIFAPSLLVSKVNPKDSIKFN